MRKSDAPDARLPLTNLELLILLALAEGPLHAYALLTRVNDGSRELVRPGPTTLYRTVGNLVSDEVIEEAPNVLAEGEDARRKYFRMTARGRAVLRAELRRLASLLDRARALGISYEGSGR